MVSFPKLFEPVRISTLEIKNRIAMAPMGIIGLTTPDGSPDQRAVDYYIERARGNVGLIITGVFNVNNVIEGNADKMHAINPASIKPFGEMCEACHALGAKVFVQLTAGFGRVAPPKMLRSKPVSASAVPYFHDSSIACRPLETAEVEQIVTDFGNAAAILAAAGVDGIELHGHEGYLFDQFATSIWNYRTDKYGGDLKGRLTLATEVLKAIKQNTGVNYPVQYRFGLKHYIKGLHDGALPGEPYKEAGRDIQEGLEMARLLEAAGYDALHVDAGCYDSWYWAHPPTYQEHGCMMDLSAMVKKVVQIPVTAVGKLDIPALAEQVVLEGKADMIAVGRGLLADPYWALKAAQGRPDDIRPCIGCHDGCLGRFMTGKPLCCGVNPACGREQLYKLTPTDKPCKVLVVGGGIAGMEAARTAALRGHTVALFEKSQALGGHVIAGSVPGFKNDVGALLKWYRQQIKQLEVDVKLESEATEESVLQEKADAVVVATGSTPFIPELPGADKPWVATCTDVLLGRTEVGRRVIVVGGGMVGCETALWLAGQDREVTIVELLPKLMANGIPVPPMNLRMLEDMLVLNKIRLFTGYGAREIKDNGLVIDGNGEQKLLETDSIVLAVGLVPDDALYRKLSRRLPRVYPLGDCREPRNIMGAIWDGYEVGRMV